jgi:hypothetical protein
VLNIEWRTIKGYEGLYEVSNDGRVRRLRFINGKLIHLENGEVLKILKVWNTK